MAVIALTDDHVLLRNGLATIIESLGHTVLFEADNGQDLIKKLNTDKQPQIVILDINMPVMDGFETANWLKKNRPDIKVLALSMYNNEIAILRMLRNGARGYILKDCRPRELDEAISNLINKGFHYSENTKEKMMDALNNLGNENSATKVAFELTGREITLLKLICTELTYKEIAEKLGISPRTIDGHRESLFEKLNLKTRIGAVLFAVKYGIMDMQND